MASWSIFILKKKRTAPTGMKPLRTPTSGQLPRAYQSITLPASSQADTFAHKLNFPHNKDNDDWLMQEDDDPLVMPRPPSQSGVSSSHHPLQNNDIVDDPFAFFDHGSPLNHSFKDNNSRRPRHSFLVSLLLWKV